MGSRDFGFLSLRPPLVAYQANGLPVPPNNVLITTNTGAASFSSTITISTINATTANSNSISSNIIDANTISATFIDVSVLSTTTHYTSTISTTTLDTDYLQANQVLINSSLKVEGNSEFIPTNPSTIGGFKIQLNNTNLTTDVAGSNLFVYRYPGSDDTYLNNTGGGSITLGTANQFISTLQINSNGNVNVNGDLIVSDKISTNTIITQYLSTFSTINLMNGNANPLELTWNTSTLFIDGQPVSTDGTVSTVSSVFWQDNGGFGNIVNKNIGVGLTKYLVGVGTTTNPLNATLDILYAGGSNPGNILNVSTANGQRLTVDNNGVTFITSSLSTNTINMTSGSINGLTTINTYFENLSIEHPGNDGSAGITLFNGKATIGTNATYNGMFLEASTTTSIILTDSSDVNTYATFGPITNILSLNTIINGTLSLISSSAVSPALFFNSDTDTGLYGISDGQMGISANGQERIRITNTDISLTPSTTNAVNIITNSPDNYTTLNIINTSNISSSVQISMQNGGGSYSLYATDNEGSPAGSGLIPSTFQIYSYYPNPLNVLTIYPSGSTIIGNNITNPALLINGPSGLGRVYDTVYNPPLSNISIIQLQTLTTGTITYDSTVSILPGKYQIQLSGEAVTYINTTDTINIAATVGDPPFVSNLPFSIASINAASLGNIGQGILGLNSGIFEYTGGTIRITVSTDNTWTSVNWTLQLVKY